MTLPAAVSIWPSIGLAALDKHRAYAWRAWELARYYDKDGSGYVSHAGLLSHFALRYNLSLSTGRKLITCAVKAGYFLPFVKRLNNEKGYKLLGVARVAMLLEITHLESHKVAVNPEKLLGKGWQSELWAAFTANQENRPRTRKTLEKITHIPRQSQRQHERKTGVTTTPTYIHDHRENPKQYLHYLRFDHPDYPKPHAFLRHDVTLQREIIVYRGPDKRQTPARYERRRGRTRSVNRQLDALLCFVERERHVKLYHPTDKGVKTAARKVVRLQISDSGDESIQALFLEKPGGFGCVQFEYQDVCGVPTV